MLQYRRFGDAAEEMGGALCFWGPEEKHRRLFLLTAAGAQNAQRVNDMLAGVAVLLSRVVAPPHFRDAPSPRLARKFSDVNCSCRKLPLPSSPPPPATRFRLVFFVYNSCSSFSGPWLSSALSLPFTPRVNRLPNACIESLVPSHRRHAFTTHPRRFPQYHCQRAAFIPRMPTASFATFRYNSAWRSIDSPVATEDLLRWIVQIAAQDQEDGHSLRTRDNERTLARPADVSETAKR